MLVDAAIWLWALLSWGGSAASEDLASPSPVAASPAGPVEPTVDAGATLPSSNSSTLTSPSTSSTSSTTAPTLGRVGTSSLAVVRRRDPAYGQLVGAAIEVSALGVGPKLAVAPVQDIEAHGQFRTLGIVRTFSVGATYRPLAVLVSWPVQPTFGMGYHWLAFTRDTDGVAGLLPAGLNAALTVADVTGVRAGFVSVEGGVGVRLCNGFSAQVYAGQYVQAPARSSPDDGQSFSFDHVRFPNVGVLLGGYVRPFARRFYADRRCGDARRFG